MDELAKLKAMVEAQQKQLQLLQDRDDATAAGPPPSMHSTESEAKDLLRKVSFDGKNFSAFKTKFQNICQLRHIWGVIEGTAPAPTDASTNSLQVYNDKINLAKSYLQSCLSNDIFDMVSDDETPAEMWSTLIANYETKTWSNTIYGMRRLSTMKYDAASDMLRHVSRVKAAIRELNDMGKTITEAETVEWILISLPDVGPDNFNAFINNLKPTPDHEVKLKTLTSALLNEEEKRHERKRYGRAGGAAAGYDYDKRKRDVNDDVRHAINALESRVASLASKRGKVDGKWCYICKKKGDHEATGHPGYDANFVRQRPVAGFGGRRLDQRPRANHGYASNRPMGDQDEGSVLYRANAIALAGTSPTPTVVDNHWTLDNGATGHVAGNKDWITSWKGMSHLVLPDKSTLRGRRGTAKIDLFDGDQHHVLKLINVTYQGSIYKNLISHVQLLRSGYELTHQDLFTTAYIHKFHGRRLNIMRDGLYVLDRGVPPAGSATMHLRDDESFARGGNDEGNEARDDDQDADPDSARGDDQGADAHDDDDDVQDSGAVVSADDLPFGTLVRETYGLKDAPKGWLSSFRLRPANATTGRDAGGGDEDDDTAANAVAVDADTEITAANDVDSTARLDRSGATDEKLMEWHHRLNHTNMDQVAKIISPILQPAHDRATTTTICDGCAQGQAKRVSYRNTRHYVPAQPLETLSADLCGPVQPSTIHKEHFTSMFIDQASRYVFGKLLKTKDDTTLHLDEITSTLDARLPGARVRMLHTDGGGEYTGHAFRAACSARGIVQKFTNAETPEESHLAEKTNEYVFNKIRTYLTITGLPKTLWGYCFEHVVYVYNHIPQELLNGRTPYEVLFGKPSRLHMLKTFGCLAYKFVPKSQRTSKLSNSAVPCVFLGYADGQLGYKLWNPKARTITVSRSVTFDETKIRNAHMFAAADFGNGRFVVPAPIDGVATDDELAHARFAPLVDADTPTTRASRHKRQPEDNTRHPGPAKRTRKQPDRYTAVSHVGADLGTASVIEPATMADLHANPHKHLWLEAMREEIDALKSNGVWKLVDLPKNRKPLKSKWVWKVKYLPCGKIERLKARLVIKGFMQIAGVDFTDTFAPVVRLDSLRVLCAVIALYDLETV
jgi:transposase InsO family protein